MDKFYYRACAYIRHSTLEREENPGKLIDSDIPKVDAKAQQLRDEYQNRITLRNGDTVGILKLYQDGLISANTLGRYGIETPSEEATANG
jgi:2',3'-cyclic-nucleotide 2'-phosphodiesterase (5'-nucleotidase family)